jgi:hypothetical protein
MSKPAGSRRTSAPMMRDSRMLPTLSLTGSSQSTHFSWTRRHLRPSLAATAATCRVWLDWMPPIDTRVSAPLVRASGTRYSSLRILLPPKASPELQSSRLAQTVAPPRCFVSRSRRWTGLGPNVNGYRGKSCRFTCALLRPVDPRARNKHRFSLSRIVPWIAVANIAVSGFEGRTTVALEDYRRLTSPPIQARELEARRTSGSTTRGMPRSCWARWSKGGGLDQMGVGRSADSRG